MSSLWRVLLLVVGLSAAGVVWWGANAVERAAEQPLLLTEPLELDVPRGSSLRQVLGRLAAEGRLENPFWLRVWLRVHDRGAHIHAGEYLLGPGTTARELVAMLEAGKVRLHAVTLVEGWTVTQARVALANAPRLRHELGDVAQSELLHALGIDAEPGRNPEGLFFPDTYVFSGATSDRDILVWAYHRLQEVLAEEWEQRAAGLPYETPYEALIMASIIERETGVPSERGDIAGVFVRRLQRGMLLQTDPTIIYGLGDAFDGNLRRSHLRDAANPYNTYIHRGLPPTPIALAGRAAIRAALNPSAGDALFFVARGDGSHHFSSTLREHERAVQEYQVRQRRSDYRSSPAPVQGAK